MKAQEEERSRIAGELHDGVLRQLSHALHPAALAHYGLPAALCAYCEEFSKARDIPV